MRTCYRTHQASQASLMRLHPYQPSYFPLTRINRLSPGWGEKPGVRIVFGRWQDVLPQLGQYDGIFFDTYGEYYDDLRRATTHRPTDFNLYTQIRCVHTWLHLLLRCRTSARLPQNKHAVATRSTRLRASHTLLGLRLIRLQCRAHAGPSMRRCRSCSARAGCTPSSTGSQPTTPSSTPCAAMWCRPSWQGASRCQDGLTRA